MKTIATMALLLGTAIAVGAAPAAEAREGRGHGRHDRGYGPAWHHPGVLHAHQVRAVRGLAHRLERATDELQRDARRAAFPVHRYEVPVLRAVHRLEIATDRFRRSTERRGPLHTHELRRELRAVEAAFHDARHGARALRSREVRRDFVRVARLIEALEDTVEPRRHLAWNDRFGRRW